MDNPYCSCKPTPLPGRRARGSAALGRAAACTVSAAAAGETSVILLALPRRLYWNAYGTERGECQQNGRRAADFYLPGRSNSEPNAKNPACNAAKKHTRDVR